MTSLVWLIAPITYPQKFIGRNSAIKDQINTVKNGMEVKRNNVYVIPPNTSMSIVDGHLKLAHRDITINGNFAGDYFLTALASAYKNNSIPLSYQEQQQMAHWA